MVGFPLVPFCVVELLCLPSQAALLSLLPSEVPRHCVGPCVVLLVVLVGLGQAAGSSRAACVSAVRAIGEGTSFVLGGREESNRIEPSRSLELGDGV